jgi:hypothetical protein
MRWFWQPPALLRQVIVNPKHSATTAYRGVLSRARGPWLVLYNAELLEEGLPPKRIDGEVHVLQSSVAFIQVLP